MQPATRGGRRARPVGPRSSSATSLTSPVGPALWTETERGAIAGEESLREAQGLRSRLRVAPRLAPRDLRRPACATRSDDQCTYNMVDSGG
jgi:hypothetical protein